jgi:hypothetical protein
MKRLPNELRREHLANARKRTYDRALEVDPQAVIDFEVATRVKLAAGNIALAAGHA